MSTFRLERDLQTFLRDNLEQLKQGLKINDGNREKVLENGRRTDIQAIDVKGQVYIELKAKKAGVKDVKQIRDYVIDEQKKDKGTIRGILVAASFTPEAVADAVETTPKVELREYGVKFTFPRPK